MALPSQDTNLVGTRLKPVTDLGLALVVGATATVTGTPFSTGLPGTVVVLAQLSSGSGDIKIKTGSTAAGITYGSPTATMTLSGTTKFYEIVETSDSAFADALLTATDPAFADTSTLFVGIQEVGGASGFQLSQLVVLSLYELRGGEDWYSIRHGGINAVGGTVGQSALAGVNNVTYVAGYQDGAGNLYLSDT